MNKTEIFKTLEEFNGRVDKSVNGVSAYFVEQFPNWREMNATNTGCWNCFDCEHCSYCQYCQDCKRCEKCFDLKGVDDASELMGNYFKDNDYNFAS